MKIAISGKMGSGKTTLAQALDTNHVFYILSFADGVRDVGKVYFRMSKDDLSGPNKDRQKLQHIGQKMREIDPDVWVNNLLYYSEGMQKFLDGNVNNLVVDDMRLKNEFDALKEAGYIMVRIVADKETRESRMGVAFTNTDDITETDLDDVQNPMDPNIDKEGRKWDVVIKNDTISLEKFKGIADKIYDSFSK